MRVVQDYPLGVLLGALLVVIIGAPITPRFVDVFPWMSGPATLGPLTTLLAIAATYAIWGTAKNRVIGLALAVAVFILLGLSNFVTHHGLIAAHLLVQITFLIYVTAVLVRVVFSARVVDGNILCGAVSIYLMTGVLWGFLYALIELAHPGSFTIDLENSTTPTTIHTLRDAPGWLVYFSFTTLTTVGFGDVLPGSDVARSMSVLEAVIGQVMMVVMIARLVGLHVAHTSGPVQSVG